MLSPFLLNKKVTLERSVITLDASAGSKRENWKAVTGSENISASIQPVSTLLKQEYASRQIIITHQIYTSVDLKPKRGDRVRLENTNTYYVVTGFMNIASRNKLFMIEGKEQVL